VNRYLQERCSITISPTAIISAMRPEEVPDEIQNLIVELDKFRREDPRQA
jgi:hypothetical protein